MSEHDTRSSRWRRPNGGLDRVDPDGTVVELESRTDGRRLAAMTEDDIEANAQSDPDNPLLTEEVLARMRRVPDVKAIRERLRLSQEQFASRFGFPLGTVRDWERGAGNPTGPARTLLRVLDCHPEAVIDALEGTDGDRLVG